MNAIMEITTVTLTMEHIHVLTQELPTYTTVVLQHVATNLLVLNALVMQDGQVTVPTALMLMSVQIQA
jgi:hypothetical protein